MMVDTPGDNAQQQPANELRPVLTVLELAAYLRIGRGAAYELVRTGTINSVRIGRLVRIPRAAVLAYLNGDQADVPDYGGRAA